MVSNPVTIPVMNYPLLTLLTQNPGIVVSSLSNLILSTHFEYTLDGHNILYNSDIIGKRDFFDTVLTNIGNQVGVKVIGLIGSNTITNILNNQFNSGASMISGISRAKLRNTIMRDIALATRNLPLSDV